MAYFLKVSKVKGHTYLAIYESFYNPDKKETAHRSYRSLGSVEKLIESGIEDPIAFYRAEVAKMNFERSSQDRPRISEKGSAISLGYFPLKAVMDSLNTAGHVRLMARLRSFEYDLNDVLCALIYARAVHPCSKRKTFHDVIPELFDSYDFSYDQLRSALAFMGENYHRFVELFTAKTMETYGLSTDNTYFDCTNFYFEIDREDDLRRKGPSKESRKDPIVGLGLLLDSNMIPVGMKIYPGNESEKPVMRKVINDLKNRCKVSGRTIHVADKGLNCSQNIVDSLLRKDGYLFSRSVKTLPETEKTWVLLDNDWQEKKDASGRLLYRYKSCIDDYPYTVIDKNNKKKTVMLKEKRLVTWNPVLAKKQKREITRLADKAASKGLSAVKRDEMGAASKYVLFSSTDDEGNVTDNRVASGVNIEAVEKDLRFAGYNMLVTSELDMSCEKMYETYHNLWRIEESFRIMKSDLDARPVYCSREETIKGHFLICYLTLLLERIFQFHVLKNEYSSSDIINFMQNFKLVSFENKYQNITASTSFIRSFAEQTGLPVDYLFLSKKDIKMVHNYRV